MISFGLACSAKCEFERAIIRKLLICPHIETLASLIRKYRVSPRTLTDGNLLLDFTKWIKNTS